VNEVQLLLQVIEGLIKLSNILNGDFTNCYKFTVTEIKYLYALRYVYFKQRIKFPLVGNGCKLYERH
jgi:hypothetical protein